MNRLSLFLALACVALSMPVSAATIATANIENVEPRTNGPFPIPGNVTLTGGGVLATSHGNIPSITWNLTATNQALNSNNTGATFTFDLTATTTDPNGVSLWGQGVNNSNAAGDNTSFGGLNGVSFSVSNVVGTNNLGNPIVFDGFTGAAAASGGSGEVNRSVEINGVAVDMLGDGGGSFIFPVSAIDFAPTATVLFDNQGEAAGGDGSPAGSLIARSLDFQFSAEIPEPSAFVLLGLAVCGLAACRRSGQ